MTRILKIKILMLVMVMLSGCSNHWRTADANLTPEQLAKLVEEIQSAEAQSVTDSTVSEVLALKSDPNMSIYFADSDETEGEQPLGPVEAVLAVHDLAFLNEKVGIGNVTGVRIFLFDVPGASTHKAGLIIGIKTAESEFSYHGFIAKSGAALSDTSYEATLTGSTGERIVLRSYDVSEGELEPVVQMRLFDFDAQGNEQSNGKLSTLIGYGP